MVIGITLPHSSPILTPLCPRIVLPKNRHERFSSFLSGTYGSVNDTVCRVDFNEAWIKPVPKSSSVPSVNKDDLPYPSLSDVPDSVSKQWITRLGKLFFIEDVSVFPVSFLDSDTIVFDFELLGTRICAKKDV